MSVLRAFRGDDAAAVAALAAACSQHEADFVLNPMWQDQQELEEDFARRDARPEELLLVATGSGDEVLGTSGVLAAPGATAGGLVCPVVAREERGQGLGGELLRGALTLARGRGLRVLSAGIGTRNRAGFSLLVALGFRPTRQHFLMRCDAPPEASLPSGFRTESAGPEDAETIHGLYVACGLDPREEEATLRALGDGRHLHRLLLQDGRACGFVELDTHWPRRPWVAFVGVEDTVRDRGLGTALVADAVGRAFDAGANGAHLLLSPANRTALRAYEKAGFELARVFDVLECALS